MEDRGRFRRWLEGSGNLTDYLGSTISSHSHAQLVNAFKLGVPNL